LLKELSKNDYTLSDEPFDLGNILLVSLDIQEWYTEIEKENLVSYISNINQ